MVSKENFGEQRRGRLQGIGSNDLCISLVLKYGPYPIIITDHREMITGWNLTAEKLFGYSYEEVAGMELSGVIIPGRFSMEGHAEIIKLTREPGMIVNRELEMCALNKAGTEFPVKLTVSYVRYAKQCFCIVVPADKEKEECIEAGGSGPGEIEAGHETYTALLNLFAHDLRTPLTSLRALTQLALRNEELNGAPRTKDLLVKISDQTWKLGKLVDEMLDVTRLQTGKISLDKSIVDFGSVLKQAADSHTSLFPAHQVLCDGIVPVTLDIDRIRIEQVLMILLNCTFRYLSDRMVVSIASFVSGEYLAVVISPAGADTDVSDPGVLTERSTALDHMNKSDAAGLGIGLFIASQIVRLHNGEIRFEVVGGQGIKFLIILPL